ncbi:MAG: extracellular solute-binding protein, partial [Psychromonas sp.]|nr:extracellular solute-binding protein [Psychromonas sp.]
MKISKKLAAVATLSAALFSSALVAQSKPVEVDFMRFFGDCTSTVKGSTDPSAFNGECSIMTALVNKFNAEHEGEIKVKAQSVAWAGFYNSLKASFGSGTPPDIAIMHGSKLFDYVHRDMATDLTVPFAENKIEVSDFSNAASNLFDYDGHFYALPWDTHAFITYVNTDIFKKAGLVDANGKVIMPKNLKEMLAQSKIIFEKTGANYMDGTFVGNGNGIRNALALTAQQGEEFISATNVDFTKKAIKRSLEAQVQLKKEGHSNLSASGGELTNFMAGKVAIHVDGTWFMGSTQKNVKTGKFPIKNVEFYPFPTFFDKPAMWTDSHSFIMPKDPKRSKEVTAASLTFLKFLYDHNLAWASTGHFPIRKSVLTSKAFLSLEGRATTVDTTKYGVSLPKMSYLETITNNFASQSDAVLMTDKNIDKALKSAQSRSRTY